MWGEDHPNTMGIMKRLLGEEHPNTLGMYTNIGSLYNSMKRFEEAAEVFEISLPIKRRVLGLQHPWTGYAMDGLVTAYMGLGRIEDAQPLQDERVELLVDAASRPDATTSVLVGAAWALLDEHFGETLDSELALAFTQRACAIAEANGSGASWDTLSTLALAQHRTGDDAAAVETQRRTLERKPEDLNPKSFEDLTQQLAEYEAAAKDH